MDINIPNIGEPIAFTVCNCENKGYYNGLFFKTVDYCGGVWLYPRYSIQDWRYLDETD